MVHNNLVACFAKPFVTLAVKKTEDWFLMLTTRTFL